MKRLCSLLLCGMILLLTVAPVSAQTEEDIQGLIIESLKTMESVDVSAYGMSQEELQKIYEKLFNRGLLPWYADEYFDWTSAPDGTVSVLTIRDLRDRGYDEEKHERMMAELIAQTCHQGMEPWQMVLSVHDYIVAHAEYSYNGVYNNGYHALVSGKTACYGYAQLFLRVMQRLNIPCEIVICDDTGEGTGHAWNAVQLNGKWYHVDVTWDDPLMDIYGRVYYDNFLKTDREFKKNGHDFEWESQYACQDTGFAKDTLWENVTSGICFLDSNTAFFRRDNDTHIRIYVVDIATGEETLLYKEKLTLVQLDGSMYTCASMGLQISNDRLWFNTPKSVCSLDLDGTDKKVEYTVSVKDKALLSFLLTDQSLLLSLMTLDGDVSRLQEALPYELSHQHSYDSFDVAPGCEQEGYQQHQCSCGITYRTNKKDPLGHEMTEQLLEDRKRFVCQNCQYTYEEMLPVQEKAQQTMPHGLVVVLIITGVTAVLLAVIIKKRKKR